MAAQKGLAEGTEEPGVGLGFELRRHSSWTRHEGTGQVRRDDSGDKRAVKEQRVPGRRKGRSLGNTEQSQAGKELGTKRGYCI